MTPDYSITNEILKNISNIEYQRSLIANTTILKNIEEKFEAQQRAKKIVGSLGREGLNMEEFNVFNTIVKLPHKKHESVKKYIQAIEKTNEFEINLEVDETEIKALATLFNSNSAFRNKKNANKTDPEQILARLTKLLDWTNSRDAIETHPIIKSAIFKAHFEHIFPFNAFNFAISDLISHLLLKLSGYKVADIVAIENTLFNQRKDMESLIRDAHEKEDFTMFIEFYVLAFNSEISTTAEQYKLLAKESVVTKAAGSQRLGSREERIVTFITNFGMLQNSDFEELFPDLSEDTVLRELKKLIKKGVIVKRGKTKSSRYELV